jgi:hypothetical protein
MVRGCDLATQRGSGPCVLDAFATRPVAAFDPGVRLLTTHVGALHTVRRSSGPSQAVTFDVPYDPATNRLDTAQRASFVGAQTWVMPRWFDQAGGRDLAQSTLAAQPFGGFVGVGSVELSNGMPVAVYNTTGLRLSRSDAFGLIGLQALTVLICCTVSDLSAQRMLFEFGNGAGAGGDRLALTAPSGNPNLIQVSIGAAGRMFSCANLTSAENRFVVQLGAGAAISSARCWQNGVELAQSSLSNGANVASYANVAAHLGASAGGLSHVGKMRRWVIWNALLAGDELTRVIAL